MSSEESKESLTYDEVTSWRSDALKLYCRQRGLKVSGSKQELVARVFAASEMALALIVKEDLLRNTFKIYE